VSLSLGYDNVDLLVALTPSGSHRPGRDFQWARLSRRLARIEVAFDQPSRHRAQRLTCEPLLDKIDGTIVNHLVRSPTGSRRGLPNASRNSSVRYTRPSRSGPEPQPRLTAESGPARRLPRWAVLERDEQRSPRFNSPLGCDRQTMTWATRVTLMPTSPQSCGPVASMGGRNDSSSSLAGWVNKRTRCAIASSAVLAPRARYRGRVSGHSRMKQPTSVLVPILRRGSRNGTGEVWTKAFRSLLTAVRGELGSTERRAVPGVCSGVDQLARLPAPSSALTCDPLLDKIAVTIAGYLVRSPNGSKLELAEASRVGSGQGTLGETPTAENPRSSTAVQAFRLSVLIRDYGPSCAKRS